MSNLLFRRRAAKCAPSIPLLDRIAKARVRSLPLPARRLARRFGLAAETAEAVARAAGFACDDER